MVFESFSAVGTVPVEVVGRFEERVPAGVVGAWREHGVGFIGDGYFRLVDPARAQVMLGGSGVLPADAVVVLTTAMADVVAWWRDMFVVAKPRLGQINMAPMSFEQLCEGLVADDGVRDGVWEWEPYPAVVERLGVPGFEECFMHVPLLRMGGRGEASQMQVGSVWMHIGLMMGLTGPLEFTRVINPPPSA